MTFARTHTRTIVAGADAEAGDRESIAVSHEDLVELAQALHRPTEYVDLDGIIRRGRDYSNGRRAEDYPHSNVLGEGANRSIRRGVTSAMWAGAAWALALEAILGLAGLTAYWLWRVL